jgi:hypothetical protein
MQPANKEMARKPVLKRPKIFFKMLVIFILFLFLCLQLFKTLVMLDGVVNRSRGKDGVKFFLCSGGIVFFEKADYQQDPDLKKQALIEIINDYNALFNANHSIAQFDSYYQDIQTRIKDQKYTNKEAWLIEAVAKMALNFFCAVVALCFSMIALAMAWLIICLF